jgi:hypothetical protein
VKAEVINSIGAAFDREPVIFSHGANIPDSNSEAGGKLSLGDATTQIRTFSHLWIKQLA